MGLTHLTIKDSDPPLTVIQVNADEARGNLMKAWQDLSFLQQWHNASDPRIPHDGQLVSLIDGSLEVQGKILESLVLILEALRVYSPESPPRPNYLLEWLRDYEAYNAGKR